MTKIEELNLKLDKNQIEKFHKYVELFLKTNSKINLISKNDEKVFIEKHLYDSLALTNFINPKDNQTILDIGTGGGLPSVPLAIFYPNIKIFAIDSIRKKINAVENFKTALNLKNLFPICNRVENINEKYDFVVSRAVASLDKILDYAILKLKNGGIFIAYKSIKYEEEINNAKKTIQKYKLNPPEIIPYALPLDEVYQRYFIKFKL